MRTVDSYSAGLTTITNAIYNPDSSRGTAGAGYPAILAQTNAQTVSGDQNLSTPVAMPYGHFGIPIDNTYGITMNIQGVPFAPVVISQLPAYANLYPLDGLVKGEAATYSTKYSLQAKLSGLKAKLVNGAGNNTATMLWGENINKVLLDILDFLEDFTNTYNGHNHGGPGPTPTQTYPADLTQDETDLAAGKGYVSDTGAPM
jgi:hypothetical protein